MEVAAAVENQRKKIHPHKFTLWVAIGSILMMFAGLTSAFIVKSNLVGWRDVEMPQIFWYSTAVILISSLTIHLALGAFKDRNMAKYRQLMGVTFVLGIAFIVMQLLGFQELWNEQNVKLKGVTGAGQFLYVIFGLHGLHVLGGIVALIVMFFRAFFGKSKNYSPVPVELAATYWHFVDLLWIYLFVFFMVIG